MRTITYCDKCTHTNMMHMDYAPTPCAYPYCDCRAWKAEPGLVDYTKKYA